MYNKQANKPALSLIKHNKRKNILITCFDNLAIVECINENEYTDLAKSLITDLDVYPRERKGKRNKYGQFENPVNYQSIITWRFVLLAKNTLKEALTNNYNLCIVFPFVQNILEVAFSMLTDCKK